MKYKMYNINKFKMYNINKLKKEINDSSINERCRKHKNDFTRKRKLTPKDLIYYSINNRGKTTKMELYDFIEQYNYENVSDVALMNYRGAETPRYLVCPSRTISIVLDISLYILFPDF